MRGEVAIFGRFMGLRADDSSQWVSTSFISVIAVYATFYRWVHNVLKKLYSLNNLAVESAI